MTRFLKAAAVALVLGLISSAEVQAKCAALTLAGGGATLKKAATCLPSAL